MTDGQQIGLRYKIFQTFKDTTKTLKFQNCVL